jgi:hypothetical protein
MPCDDQRPTPGHERLRRDAKISPSSRSASSPGVDFVSRTLGRRRRRRAGSLGVDHGIGHAPRERRLHPAALLGVIGESPVVDGQPGSVVLPGHEGPDLDAGWPRRLLAERERDALLEGIPLMAEPGARGSLVVALVGLEDPEHDETAALGGDVLDGPLEQRDLGAGAAACLGVHDRRRPSGPEKLSLRYMRGPAVVDAIPANTGSSGWSRSRRRLRPAMGGRRPLRSSCSRVNVTRSPGVTGCRRRV